LSTKIHALVDALGNPISVFLTGGETYDLVGAEPPQHIEWALIGQIGVGLIAVGFAQRLQDLFLRFRAQKQFAGFEIAEQLTMAQVLTDTPAPTLASLDNTHAAQLQALSNSPPGHGFDAQ